VPCDDEVAMRDADALERQEDERLRRSAEVAAEYARRIADAGTAEELRQVGQQLTPEVKNRLVLNDLDRVRHLYGKRLAGFKAPAAAQANGTT
jgi:hypothetical protein